MREHMKKQSGSETTAVAWPVRGVSGLLVAAIVLALTFSSCTCQRDIPEPPKRSSRLSRTRNAWGGLPTRRAPARPERRDLGQRKPIEREQPTMRPAPQAAGEEGEVELPEDFPGDIPIVKDSELFGIQALPAGAKNVLFRTEKDVPEVFNYYRDSMSGAGWDVTQEYQRDNQSFLSFKKGDTITNMTVAVDPKTGKQVIAVMYYDEEPLPFPEF